MTQTTKREMYAVFIALLTVAFLFMIDRAFAETSVKIENSTGKNDVNVESSSNTSVKSESTSNVKNRVEVNGKVYIDEENTTDGSNDSKIEVNLKNNEGSVKYNVNGEEKTIQISPDDDEDEEKDTDEEEDKEENDKEDSEGGKENKDTKNVKQRKLRTDLIQQMMDLLDNFFTKLSSIFNSGN